ncbi:hypothetical protein MRX96_004624 [Rhipicephalus microplus]
MRTLVLLHADLLQYQEDVIADRDRQIEELRIQLHKVRDLAWVGRAATPLDKCTEEAAVQVPCAPTSRSTPTPQPAPVPQAAPTPARVSVGCQQGTSGTAQQPKRQRLNSPSPEAAAQRTEECSRQLRLLEETKAEAQQPHQEFRQEVRGLRSSLERVAAAGERIAAALDLLVGALVPGHVMPVAPPQSPPSSP